MLFLFTVKQQQLKKIDLFQNTIHIYCFQQKSVHLNSNKCFTAINLNQYLYLLNVHTSLIHIYADIK